MKYIISDEEPTLESPKEIIECLYWVLHIDGATNSKKSRASLIIASLKGVVTEYVLRFNFNISNNGAEYEVLFVELQMAKELGIKRFKVFTDFQLIVGQIQGQFEVKDSIIS